ncbi:MAG: DNA polymerase III subunit delta [Rhodothalassiaceae bacterium]
MTKANKAQAAAAIKRLDPSIRAVLIYGRDDGMIREYAGAFTKQVLGGPDDPFRHIRLNAEDLAADAARLADERAALSFSPGRRLIRLDGAADSALASVEAALDGPQADALVLLVAGELSAKSKLRKLAEKRSDILAIACFPDEAADLDGLIRQVLRQADLIPDADAIAYLQSHLGSDRALTRNELDKLVLYKEGAADRRVSLDDAQACVGDGSALTLQTIAELVTAGQAARLDAPLERAFAAGESVVAILRILTIRLQRLHLMRAHMAQGLDAAAACAKLAPPPFWKERDGLIRDARRWPSGLLARALVKLMHAEIAAKSTGLPDQAMCHRTLIEIAAAARR